MRALIVDDSSFIREYLRHLLSRMDIVCEEAVDGSDALTVLAGDETFDLMLLDVNMPVMNGLDAARRIKAIAPNAAMLMFTMHASPELLHEARAAGIRDVVSKTDRLVERLFPALREACA